MLSLLHTMYLCSIYLLLLYVIRDFRVELENPHVIEKHQIWIGMMGKGPDGVMLSSSYENRSVTGYKYRNLINTPRRLRQSA